MNASIQFTEMTITPIIAQDWLKQSEGFAQRRIQPNAVARYASEMKDGTWHPGTADPIRLSTHRGDLVAIVDGQHRLAAIARSGVAQRMFVATNVDAEAFKYIDQGLPRSLANVLEASGYSNATDLARFIGLLRPHRNGHSPLRVAPSSESPGTALDWYERSCPGDQVIWDTWYPSVASAAKKHRLVPSVLMFFWVHWYAENSTKATAVLNYLLEPFTTSPADNIFAFMAQKLQSIHDEQQTAASTGRKIEAGALKYERMRVLQHAWAYNQGRVTRGRTTFTKYAGYCQGYTKFMVSQPVAAAWEL
jgi:hypothetical protein